MRTKKALSLLLSLLLVLGLLSGAAGALAEDAAQTGVTYYINGLEDLLKLADNCAVDTIQRTSPSYSRRTSTSRARSFPPSPPSAACSRAAATRYRA